MNIKKQKIRHSQEVDVDLRFITDYLALGVLPHYQKKSRKCLLQQADYVLLDGILFHCQTAKAERTKIMSHYQLVLPKSLIQTVLELCYSLLGGHEGIQDILYRVREHYYFLMFDGECH